MGREVRRVVKGWVHPRNRRGDLQPMHDEAFEDAAREWLDKAIAWDNGTHESLVTHPTLKAKYPFYWQWENNAPDPDYYRPKWKDEERTCYQYYETVTEGTPVSPVFDTAEGLVQWLVKHEGHSEQAARTFVKKGWAPSFIQTGTGEIISGVDVFKEGSPLAEKKPA